MTSVQRHTEKGKLVPVQVPWRVSLTTPFLTVHVKEFEVDQIEFVATFWSEMIGSDERKVKLFPKGLSLVLIKSPVEEDRALSVENFDYDWSELENIPNSVQGLADWSKHHNEKWKKTGFCPDPNMYEVIGSEKFISIYPPGAGYKHYLLIGEMMAIEFLCTSWIWEAGGIIDWFKNK